MMSLQEPQLAGPMANVIPLDASKIRHRSLLARCVAGLLRALHASRRLEGERVIRRYRHLICVSETQGGSHPDAGAGRR